jgi:serine/threonine protein kinase
MYPNLKFAAPEISQGQPTCSTQSDLFSIGCVLYFLLALSMGKDPYLMGFYDSTNPSAHQQEVNSISIRL